MKTFEVVLNQDEGFYSCLRDQRPPMIVYIKCTGKMKTMHKALDLLYDKSNKKYIHATVFTDSGDIVGAIQK